jgi:uncharacterized membrane protein
MKPQVNMPRWPALLLLVSAAACATQAVNSDRPSSSQESYTARGQEPGWSLAIANGRIDYVGNYGDKRINVARPEPRTTFNGHRYETQRLIVDITHARCNDAMSGQGFSDQVAVTADGQTYRGCGGLRRTDWDN